MNEVFIDDRVAHRHPEVSNEDVLAAWDSCIRSRPRSDRDFKEYIAIGTDTRGRLIELVAVMNDEGDWLVYHANTPPSHNALRELGFEKG